jgi:hypothetical protein
MIPYLVNTENLTRNQLEINVYIHVYLMILFRTKRKLAVNRFRFQLHFRKKYVSFTVEIVPQPYSG